MVDLLTVVELPIVSLLGWHFFNDLLKESCVPRMFGLLAAGREMHGQSGNARTMVRRNTAHSFLLFWLIRSMTISITQLVAAKATPGRIVVRSVEPVRFPFGSTIGIANTINVENIKYFTSHGKCTFVWNVNGDARKVPGGGPKNKNKNKPVSARTSIRIRIRIRTRTSRHR